VADERGWQPTDVLREAWLADTILLLSESLGNAVLTGGSGVRNITKVYRLTYDVDFDTPESNIETIYEWMRRANKAIGIKGSLERYGALGGITVQQDRNIKASFEGPNHLAPFVRWTGEKQFMRIHIMGVFDIPEMFEEYEDLDLETAAPVKAKVHTANRKHLFYRKAIRAQKESRPEDFMDLTFILQTAGAHLREIVDYCSQKNKREGVRRGLEILISDRKKFVDQVGSRLVYEGLDKPHDEWVEESAGVLESFRAQL
jgi:hypothetical protein